ncbi:hypothetical protein MF271_22725 (plasmid) [Deinococcus sp. KNUC1210]|uniref:hypothetical protein n=1 Tax=Deinococcus sp. KNUC1210 TaxID=2917691 RepID=UPI001EF0A89C|nr:hypothetical protein [Deinococcus sp. KNUC1210]ULH18281.1 hypothetical protein MF271_22725 [Deinococcus sp. KNUC1210]
MKRFSLLLVLTSALFTACGSERTPPVNDPVPPVSDPVPPPVPPVSDPTPPAPPVPPISDPVPPVLANLQITGIESPLQISQPAQVRVNATDTSGQPFVGTPTYTSSDPNVIAVMSDGTLDVRHLSTTPVLLTVEENGIKATKSVTTYGLDVSGGTYHDWIGDGAPTTNIIMAFRDAQGNANTTDIPVSIALNSSTNNTSTNVTLFAGSTIKNFSRSFNLKGAAGYYKASANINGMAFYKVFPIDYTYYLDLPNKITFTSNSSDYSMKGALPSGAATIKGRISNSTLSQTTPNILSLPASGTWDHPLSSGTYSLALEAMDYNSDSGQPFPDRVNYSWYPVGNISIP